MIAQIDAITFQGRNRRRGYKTRTYGQTMHSRHFYYYTKLNLSKIEPRLILNSALLLLHHYKSALAHLSYWYSLFIGIY